jgi:hypothetical protein
MPGTSGAAMKMRMFYARNKLAQTLQRTAPTTIH